MLHELGVMIDALLPARLLKTGYPIGQPDRESVSRCHFELFARDTLMVAPCVKEVAGGD
jgi:hypothetical protein